MKNIRPAVLRLGAVVAVFGVLVAGCGEDSDLSRPTVTLEVSRGQADTLLADIEQALPAGARFEPPAANENDCYKPHSESADGRRQAGRLATVSGLPEERQAEVYAAARAYFGAHDFKITKDVDKVLTGTRSSDGFLAMLYGGLAPGQLMQVSVRAPCVWPDGTPQPKR
ncbi:hypothetical protein GCM10018781_06930 [Kitasatospora indigofera]|uniref:Lipoprotein n=1 Tax=Kitasatospora indigofera TaxID=67307 RepID=A0A919KKZ8_9ACTN|nr:hypothetical protein [Kitasatospora indigofera]GHH61092.1 hypothetical protein GCM10018781_06930 [Kitasatospora indigofera]